MTREVKLDPEERDLLASYERGEWQSLSAMQEERQQYQSYATSVLEAAGLVSISLPTEDLSAIRRKAAEVGVPYQTLIADIVHRFVASLSQE